MNIIRIVGGLANQMCCYTFLRYLEITTREPYVFDDLWFKYTSPDAQNVHYRDGLELEKLFPNIKVKFISDYLTKEEQEYIIKTKKELGNKINIPNLLIEHGFDIKTLVWEYPFNNDHHLIDLYLEYIENFPGEQVFLEHTDYKEKLSDIYYIGVGIRKIYFDEIKDTILNELEFKPITDSKNIDYMNYMLDSMSIGIHVRLGDFQENGAALDAFEFKESIGNFRDEIVGNDKEPVFFIFSDDLSWCKEHRKELGFLDSDEIVFIEGNSSFEKNHLDMQLMTYCKYLISNASSTFSIMASRLNKNLIKHKRIYKKM